MGRRRDDLSDREFGRWYVIGPVAGRPGYWHCRCACGGEHEVSGKSLKKGPDGGSTQCVKCALANRVYVATPARARAIQTATARAAVVNRKHTATTVRFSRIRDLADSAEREQWDAARIIAELRKLTS